MLAVVKSKCAVCGNSWRNSAAYCPRCGSPVLPRPRWTILWELTVVAIASLLIFWLTKGR